MTGHGPRSDPVLRFSVMTAAVWTAIGLLTATSLGALFYLGARIDALGGRLHSLGGRLDSLGGRIDSLASRMDARFDSLEARIDSHLDRHAG